MERLVHVVPLGWEHDRVVLPARHMHAHKVYLLCNPDSVPQQNHFFHKVVASLNASKIETELVRVDANADFKGLIREVARLVQKESKAGNRVYVNMSGAGKVAAAASTLAAMAHLSRGRGVIYYVVPKDYIQDREEVEKFGLSRGMKGDPQDLPIFELRLPPNDHRVVLHALLAAQGFRLTYRDVILELRGRKVRGFENAEYGPKTERSLKNRLNITLNKRILQPLHKSGWIEIIVEGRTRSIQLTPDGEHIAALSATV